MWCVTVRRLSSCSRAVTIWNHVACRNCPEVAIFLSLLPCTAVLSLNIWVPTHIPLASFYAKAAHCLKFYHTHFTPGSLTVSLQKTQSLFLPMPSCMNQNRPVSHLRFPKRKVEGESIVALQISIIQVPSSGNTNSSLFEGLLVYTQSLEVYNDFLSILNLFYNFYRKSHI